jgi:acetyl esterase/lipase
VRRCRLLPSLAALVAACAVVASGCGSGGRPAAETGTTTAAPAPPSSTTPPTTAAPTTAAPTTSDPVTSTTLAPHPPYPITTLTLPLVDTSRPTVADGVEISPHRALTTVVLVPDAPGRRPLVVFGPGFDVGPATYGALLEAWAQHGYVVAAVEFPLADPAVAGAHLDEADLQNEPGDLRFVADSLVAPTSPVRARVNASEVAVAGHSDGGEAALAACVQPAPPGAPPFRACITMSVQPLTGTPPTANPPILFTQGDADTINPPSYGYSAFADASPPKYLEILHGGGHLPPLEQGSPWLPTVGAVTEAFLDAYVAGDAPVSAVLASGSHPPLATITAG